MNRTILLPEVRRQGCAATGVGLRFGLSQDGCRKETEELKEFEGFKEFERLGRQGQQILFRRSARGAPSLPTPMGRGVRAEASLWRSIHRRYCQTGRSPSTL